MDMYQLAKARMNAERSAEIATPAIYRLNDEIGFHADSFENNSSLALQADKAWSELDIMDLPRKLAGATTMLKSRLVNIIMSDIGVTDQMAKIAMQGQKEKLIKAEIEKFQKQVTNYYKRLVEARVERLNSEAVGAQVRRMYGTSLGASEADSEEKEQSMAEIESSYIVHPDDIIATA